MKGFLKILIIAVGYSVASFFGIFIIGVICRLLAWLFIPDRSVEQLIALILSSLGSVTKIWYAAMFVSFVGFIIKCFAERNKSVSNDVGNKSKCKKFSNMKTALRTSCEKGRRFMKDNKLIVCAIIVATSIVIFGVLMKPCDYRYQWIGKEVYSNNSIRVFDRKLGRLYTFGERYSKEIDFPNHIVTESTTEHRLNYDTIVITDDPELPEVGDEANIPDFSDKANK